MRTPRLRLLSALLSVAMLLTFLPTAAFAGGDVVTFTYDNITYTVIDETNKTVEVTGYTKNFSGGAVTIPSTVSYNGKDYTVTKIGVCAFYLCGICVDPIIHQSKFKK